MAWGFLLPVGFQNQLNTEKQVTVRTFNHMSRLQVRLQLYKYAHGAVSTDPQIPDVFLSWKKEKKAFFFNIL